MILARQENIYRLQTISVSVAGTIATLVAPIQLALGAMILLILESSMVPAVPQWLDTTKVM